MRDVRIAEIASSQFNRVARTQLAELGLSDRAIEHRVRNGRLVPVEVGVFAVGPVLEGEPWGRRMAATLTAPQTYLSHFSAAAAWGFWTLPIERETVTRPGSGGVRQLGGVIVHRSALLDGDTTSLREVPITTVPRTVIDLAAHISERGLAWVIREAVRVKRATVHDLATYAETRRGRRGVKRLMLGLARYSGLPLERARSGAEVRALELIRDSGRRLPELNRRIAGEEADLVWRTERLIIEIDGAPFHQDRGEDTRKQAAWEAAGFLVRRIAADAVYEQPKALLALTPNQC